MFFELLNKYKKIDSGGRYLNNIGGPVKDKFMFDLSHKFSIAFENCVSNYYTTEKIIEAFAAGCIPIYYGNPKISKEINTNAFINCHEFNSWEAVVKRVIEIDSDDILYQNMMHEPVFNESIPSLLKLEQFLQNIMDQSLNKARRRPFNTRISEKENEIKILRQYNALIGHKAHQVNSLLRRLMRHSL